MRAVVLAGPALPDDYPPRSKQQRDQHDQAPLRWRWDVSGLRSRAIPPVSEAVDDIFVSEVFAPLAGPFQDRLERFTTLVARRDGHTT